MKTSYEENGLKFASFEDHSPMPTVQLFATCLVDSLYPHWGDDVVAVLRRAGAHVELPHGQTCCGQPSFNAGLRSLARPLAQHTIRVLEESSTPVVVPSGSCAAMIKHGYPRLFEDDPAWQRRANDLAGRVYEFTEYLVDVLGVVDVGACWSGTLAYHASCHLLRDMNVDRQPRLLLAAVRGAQLVDLPGATECCGFGGVFSAEHAPISSAMLARKLDALEHSRAETLVACDAGCISNINGGLHRLGKKPRAVHIARILANRGAS
jgi:L-lactate dehydrogenase complex protein LldE